MIVRRFKDMADVDNMISLGAEMHRESMYADRPYMPAKLASYGRQFLSEPTKGVGILAEEDGVCHGIMAGWALQNFYNDELCARDMILYVRKEKRGGTTAMRMVKEFERWAKEVGAKEITIGISAAIDNDKATRFYNALGYSHRGVTLSKEVCHHG